MTVKNKQNYTRANISFLLGSGFSIPDKLPSVYDINKRLCKISENEIYIGSDQRAFFLNGQLNNNNWERYDERLFLQEFLKFYNNKILKLGEEFNYERFYDYYSSYLSSNENYESIEYFYKKFTSKFISEKYNNRDCYNRVSDFNRTFNQLLASLLHNVVYQGSATYLNYITYEAFINFLKYLINNYDVKVHSLNHDLLFDFLGKYHTDLSKYYSDGYDFEGSPFYGTISQTISEIGTNQVNKTFYVKLRRFTNSYSSKLAFFKLHGSIDNIIVQQPNTNTPVSHIKREHGVLNYYFESKNDITNEFNLFQLFDEVSPNFISGTTNKIRLYKVDPYYNNQLEHFKNNLFNSEFLFVIGYGFSDPGINSFINDYFSVKKNGKIIIIDPKLPTVDFLESIEYTHIPKGIQDVTFTELVSLISSPPH